jgi:hypothetical protein
MNLQELLTKLETPIVIRPTRRMTQGELETYLDKAADILRGNADHSEFRGYVFALLFYKRISDCYEEVRIPTNVTGCTEERDRCGSADAWCSDFPAAGHDEPAQGCPQAPASAPLSLAGGRLWGTRV